MFQFENEVEEFCEDDTLSTKVLYKSRNFCLIDILDGKHIVLRLVVYEIVTGLHGR